MNKKKSTLEDLKLKSFVTALNSEEMDHLKGGMIKVRGRRFTYNVRWTSVDTRTEPSEGSLDHTTE